ncbi:MAG: outer membrane beta-barrel protein [Opitutales bacterium]
MKSLRPIALLTLTAAAAQAYNIEFQFGVNKPQSGDLAGNFKSNSATGIAWSANPTEQISLGVTYSLRTLEHTPTAPLSTAVSNDVKTLTVDFTYELSPSQSGIRPFVGVNLGNSWIDTASGNDTAVTGMLNAGLRFDVSDSVDVVLGARYFTLWNVNYTNTVEEDTKGWESFAAIRLKF